MGGERKCKNWLTSYLKYTDVSEAPERFHFWSGIVAIAGALRRKVWLDMGLFEWTPNFFVFLVAPPGIVSKSTTASIAMDLLREVPGVEFGPSSVTWQALIERFEEVYISWHPPMTSPSELMGPGIDMSCLTIEASELGTFFNPADREMVDVLVHLWDGKRGRFTKTTISRGEKVATNPWLNLIACTTPAWIAEHISGHFTGGGFSSRSIFVFADSKRRLIPYPFLEMGATNRSLRADLLSDLKGIAEISGEYRLTAEALELGKSLYEENYRSPPAALANDQLIGYLARKQTHLHKLAITLAAAESNNRLIEVHHLRAAEQALSMAEADMPRVFSAGRHEPIVDVADAILRVIYEHKEVKRTDLFRHFYRQISWPTYSEALEHLLNSGFVTLRLGDGGVAYLSINDEIANAVSLRLVAGGRAVSE